MLSLHTAGLEPALDGLVRSFWGVDPIDSRAFTLSRFHGARETSGIHVGIARCTAVKVDLKHTLEASLQAYFTSL